MRRWFPAFLVLTVSALIGGRAAAQITLVPGPQTLVSVAPKFIAAADFNHDGIEDAVVTNVTSSKVTILFGSPDVSFSRVVDAPVGRVLRGLEAGDLNQDGLPDIAVVGFLDSRVFVITNNPDSPGTLNRPVSFKTGLRPIDAAIGNFDGKNGNDIVTANETVNKATVLLNLGGTRGFTPLGDVDLGKKPKRIAAADLNGDGFDDIIAVNTGSRAADDVSILLNTGVGSFKFPVNFTVGAGAEDVAITDVNGDGVPDLLVLNTISSTTANEFSVTVLVNQTTIENGKPQGTGIFNRLTDVKLHCPSTIGGIAILCSPNFLAAGDYDDDGFVDFAVSFFTRPTSGSSTTPGLLEAFAGHGDGTFDFSTQVSVGNDPEGVVAADFTGDGIPDIAVGEQGTRTVRIVNSLPAPKRPAGSACMSDRICSTHHCVDGVCCASASCPAGQFCDIPGEEGVCSAPAPNGTRCTNNAQCFSGNCVDGFCCASASCPAGEFCNTGQCMTPSNNGEPCSDPAQCLSNFCIDGFCCGSATCPQGQFCTTGVCKPPGGPGIPCTDPVQCASGNCVNGFCCTTASCPPGQFCNTGECMAPGGPGTPCNSPAECTTGSCVNGFCCNSTSCPPGEFCNTGDCAPQNGNGIPCNDPAQCLSGFCTDRVCCDSDSCPAGPPQQFCNIPGAEGTCTAPGPIGAPCTDPAQCLSDFCVDGACCGTPSCPTGQSCNVPGRAGQCTVAPTATPTPTLTPIPTSTPTPQPTGRHCGSDTQCVSNHCVDTVCCSQPFCPSGQACNVDGKEGQCFQLPTATPTVPLPNGFPCGADTQCQSGHCVDGACCVSASCPGGLCNISGSAGQCTLFTPTPTPPPKGLGLDCETDANCISGHCTDSVCCTTASCADGQFCNVPDHLGQCADAPTPTPTLLPDGLPCTDPSQCTSGFCTDGFCCSSDSCPADERCDIFGFEGDCSPTGDVGQPCNKNTDCNPLLICAFNSETNQNECSVPPTATPTLLALATPTPPLGPIIDVSRGGGCSMSPSANDGAWLLAALPIFLWMRRSRLQFIRMRQRRRR